MTPPLARKTPTPRWPTWRTPQMNDAITGDTDGLVRERDTGTTETVEGLGLPKDRKPSTNWSAYVAGLVLVVALAALAGWLGLRAYQSQRSAEQREIFLQVGRQGAVNLTTIDFADADTDIQRILDSATGAFYDDFAKRSEPFVDVVKQAQSKTMGTVTESGLESSTDTSAQVLVAVTVQTSNAGAAEQRPRSWRMRISVQKVGGDAKISNVTFVP